MGILELAITGVVCLVVGLLIGWSGIAGFLLPIFFTGYLNLPNTTALAISFFCFFISGSLGSYQYYKKGNLPVKLGLYLGLGSLVGAMIGVSLNKMIPTSIVTLILYLVVLLSGCSILLRNKKTDTTTKKIKKNTLSVPFLIILGLVTSIICAFSGAGGPILVMPLLVVFGITPRIAVGVALFDSIFIAIPSMIGYLSASEMNGLFLLFLVSGITHGVGVLLGSYSSEKIPQHILKTAVGYFSIAMALYKLIGILIS